MRKIFDVEYGSESLSQKLDLYLPEDGEKFPLLCYIHGGAFSHGDKQKGSEQRWTYFIKLGFAVASINYRLSSEVGFPAGVNDCKSAVKFLLENSEAYGIDRQRVAIVGSSAGGTLALMSAGSLSEVSKKCIVAWYPAVNMLSIKNMAQDIEKLKSYIEEDFELYFREKFDHISDEKLLSASPITYLDSSFPPTLLQHGDADQRVPFSQSVEFFKKAKSLGVEIEFDTFQNAGHGDPLFKTEDNMKRVTEFVLKHLDLKFDMYDNA